LPEELLAVPIIESGYRNFKHRRVAGLWMFIEDTARAYNLRVDEATDDRLDVELETDAAMRLLGADYLRFQDWGLALMAYNAGEVRVQKGIDATGSRDPWKLIDAGFQGDADYLAKVIAAVILLRNPTCLD
jgi:membrane-bound lytic murein transglycosylase D